MRQILTAWTAGLPLEIVYDIRDDGTDPANLEHNFGLLANNYSDKPAIVAVRQLTAAANGRRLVGLLDTQQSTELHVVRLDGASDQVFIAWMSRPGGSSIVRVSVSPAAATDVYGKALASAAATGREFVVNEESGPIYLTLPYATSGSGGAADHGNDSRAGCACRIDRLPRGQVAILFVLTAMFLLIARRR